MDSGWIGLGCSSLELGSAVDASGYLSSSDRTETGHAATERSQRAERLRISDGAAVSYGRGVPLHLPRR